MKQPNKNDYFIDIDGTEILPYDKAYRAYKEYADDLEDYIKHLSQAKNNEVLDLVSVREFECDDVVCTNDGRMWVITEIDGEDVYVTGNGKRDYPLEKSDITHAH